MSNDLTLQPPQDGISSVSWSPDSSRLLVSSWDMTVRMHKIGTQEPPATFEHPAATLCARFGSNEQVAFSGCLDKRVRQIDVDGGLMSVLGKHDDAVSALEWCDDHGVLVTGSWDRTIKVWRPNAPGGEPQNALLSTHTMPERVYNLSYSPATKTLLVSMAHRHVYVYHLPDLVAGGDNAKPQSSRESALKVLTRSVACMADGKGWASGSIDGRIAVEYFDHSPDAQSAKYAFRAHRQAVDGVEQVYPINALAYHPVHNTFASGGSDGFISLWDHLTKKRMKHYPKYPTSISALAFSPDGTKLAIGASNEHDNSLASADPESNQVLLMIKDTVMEDSKPKVKA